MNCKCRVCKRTGLLRSELRKDDSVFSGICKKCWSKQQALNERLARAEKFPERYKSCTDCDRILAKIFHTCTDCNGTNFEEY